MDNLIDIAAVMAAATAAYLLGRRHGRWSDEFGRRRADRYEAELAAAAEVLGRVHPAGRYKAIGLLEVAAAVSDLFPANRGERADEDWLLANGFDYAAGASRMARRVTPDIAIVMSGDLRFCDGPTHMVLEWSYGGPAGGGRVVSEYHVADDPTVAEVDRLVEALC